MKKFLLLPFIVTLLAPLAVCAQRIEDYRGGWIADVAGVRHIYYLVLRNNKVSGFFCTDCQNPDQLAFVDDGTLDAKGLHFTLYHSAAKAQPYQEQVEASLRNGELQLTRTRTDNKQVVSTLLHRAPVPAAPAVIADFTPNKPVQRPLRTLAGPAEIITAEKVLGLWLWGTGPQKQYFIFKAHKGGIRGMVCGPCDSVRDMAPLEQISMNGTNFHYEIVHEDNGLDFDKHGPHSNVTDAMLSANELLMSVIPSFETAGFKPLEMTLLGPVRYQPQ